MFNWAYIYLIYLKKHEYIEMFEFAVFLNKYANICLILATVVALSRSLALSLTWLH